ncbi:MAG: hypothetical protein GXN93_03690 [Candidatus Diapherotrites archaeon]|nr:hypothetical protein [Candidatus Diapherotrites archaeon]
MCNWSKMSRETRYALDILVFLVVVVVGFLVPRDRSFLGISADFIYLVFVLAAVAVFAFNVAVRLARLEDAVFGKERKG